MNEISDSHVAKAGRFLSFRLGDEIYAITIESVSEINGVCKITTIPNTPTFLRGVIDLRGKVIPVIDLRIKFGMPAIEYNKETCIIVVEAAEGNMGVIVDTVNEVIDLNEAQIEKPPRLGDHDHTKFISGMGKLGGQILILINIGEVLSPEEMRIMQEKKIAA